jgi:micrococcal nuclease
MKQVLLLTLLLAFTASAFEFTGKVVGVTDGDPITVLYQGNKQYKIRLQHIDCPEAAQDFGSKAKKALSAKVFGQVVTIKWDEMDRYKRVLGNVYIGKRWVNLEMVREGMAWHYKYYSKDVAMAAAETRARAAKAGIWSMANPTAPWDFRRGKGVAKLEIGQPNTAVFVTRSGAKYHRGDWQFVARSKLPTTLALARGRYTPCSACAPPVLKERVNPADPFPDCCQ